MLGNVERRAEILELHAEQPQVGRGYRAGARYLRELAGALHREVRRAAEARAEVVGHVGAELAHVYIRALDVEVAVPFALLGPEAAVSAEVSVAQDGLRLGDFDLFHRAAAFHVYHRKHEAAVSERSDARRRVEARIAHRAADDHVAVDEPLHGARGGQMAAHELVEIELFDAGAYFKLRVGEGLPRRGHFDAARAARLALEEQPRGAFYENFLRAARYHPRELVDAEFAPRELFAGEIEAPVEPVRGGARRDLAGDLARYVLVRFEQAVDYREVYLRELSVHLPRRRDGCAVCLLRRKRHVAVHRSGAAARVCSHGRKLERIAGIAYPGLELRYLERAELRGSGLDSCLYDGRGGRARDAPAAARDA